MADPISSGPVVHVIDEAENGVDAERWERLVAAVQSAEGVTGPAETTVFFVDEEEIAALNEEHLGGTGPTDVLSFPLDDAVDPATGVRVVGDIVICHSVAEKNAAGHAGTVDAEIALLLVHGTLHLLGYDHAEPEERALMWSTERTHLQSLYGPMPQDPWVLP